VVSRRLGRRLSEPVEELVGWAGRIVRREPLPVEARAGGGDEFAVLRDAFRRMAAELEESRRRELEAERARAWVGMARRVAHELKNPLTPMRLAVHTLQRRANTADPVQREAFEVIAAESERLDELARAFAQFGRLPEGPPSEIDLAEMLEYLLRSHLPPEISYRLEAPPELPRILGHHDALSRAFANLILNAAEAVDVGQGSITVELRALPERSAVEVCVLDNGPGISPEHLERVWEPDFSTKKHGTGLGLALVRQTAVAHGGAAWAMNREGGGAEFRVVLPVEIRQSPVVSRQLERQRDTTGEDVEPMSAPAPLTDEAYPDGVEAGRFGRLKTED
jgi:signal transduction histidine kinase